MKIEAFKNKIWLATPTMHGDELMYVQQAYDSKACDLPENLIDYIE